MFPSGIYYFIMSFVLLVMVPKYSKGFFNQIEDDIVTNISQAVVNIIDTSFVERRQIRLYNIFTKSNNQSKIDLLFGNIIDAVTKGTNTRINVRNGQNTLLPSDSERHFSVLLVDGVVSLKYLFGDFLKYNFHLEGYFVIILHTVTPHYYDELNAILLLNWEIGLVDVNVLVYALHNLILLFTSYPFHEFHCKVVPPVLVNRFIDSQWQHDVFYPNKLRNLHGCPLICATWEDMPYLKVIKSGKNDKINLIGFEGKLLEYIADRLNFKLKIYWVNEKEIAETLDNEGVVFQKFFSSGIDFSIGAFRYKPTKREDFYAPTQNYFISYFFFVISGQSDPLGPIYKLFVPFSIEVWLLLLGFMVAGMFAICIASYLGRSELHLLIGEYNSTPFYNMFVVCLGGNISRPSNRLYARFFLMIWLIGTFTLRSAYQAFIFHFIRTNIRLPIPENIDELLTHKYKFLATEPIFNAMQEFDWITSSCQITNQSGTEVFPHLLKQKEKLAVISNTEYIGYFRRFSPKKNDIFILPDRIMNQHLSIYMKKSSPLLDYFSTSIHYFINEGFKRKNELDLLDMKQKKGDIGKKGLNAPKVLKIENINSMVQLLYAGWSVSFLVFLIEHIFDKIIRLITTIKRIFK